MSGGTLWLTGLSGSGKSTLAQHMRDRLCAQGERVEILDGDDLRQSLSRDLGFSRDDRNAHVERVGFVAHCLARHGVWAIVPVIAPYAETREINRQRHRASGTRFLEVYVSTPLEECMRRDVKGLYAKAHAGEIIGMTGCDDPYEVPSHPDLILDTTHDDVVTSGDKVMTLLSLTN